MKHLPKFILPLAALAGISLLVAQEAATPKASTKPATATNPAPASIQKYDYRMALVEIPMLPARPLYEPIEVTILNRSSDWEIVSVVATTAPVQPSSGSGGKPTTREVLIYTLRKAGPQKS